MSKIRYSCLQTLRMRKLAARKLFYQKASKKHIGISPDDIEKNKCGPYEGGDIPLLSENLPLKNIENPNMGNKNKWWEKCSCISGLSETF